MWDNNGNLLSDGVKTYTFDHANRLKTVTGPGLTASYVYRCNGLSRDAWGIRGCESDRVSQTVNGVTTNYVLDQAAGLTQVLSDGTNTYLYGNGRIGQFTAQDSEYYLTDALGSVRQMVDGSGEITLTISYDPYGNVMSSLGNNSSAYGYTGEMEDASTGMVYMRARYYSSQFGRFLSQDTWQGDYNMPSTLNRWIYTGNNPITRIDPTGKWYCQSGLIPNHPDCISWVNNALQKLQAGPTGQKVANYFHTLDATFTALRGLFTCSPLPIAIRYPLTLKVLFEPVIPNILGANAFTISPNEIHINSSLPGYSGSVPSTMAVITFGHEITHLEQLGAEFSIQGEMLSTIVGYYLEGEQGETHRDDAKFIINNKLNPWNKKDLETYAKQTNLPWSLIIGNGLPRNWLGNWNIILPYDLNDPGIPVS